MAASAAAPPAGPKLSVKEISERYWEGNFKAAGAATHPIASFVFAPTQPIETYQDGLGFALTFANVTIVDTDEGLVLIDCGGSGHARGIYEELLKWGGGKPVHTVIYTHGHIDHCMGVKYIEKSQTAKGQKAINVIAHENVVDRFERYKKTADYNHHINSRQFQSTTKWPTVFRYPDVTYQKSLEIEVGKKKKEKFVLFHDKGETDDSTWVWIPERKAICAGDLFIWASPNCGNPQKVQRYPVEWAVAMKKMLALDAEYFFPGHGPPIVGKERIRQALSDTAKFLDSIVDQTLALINKGRPLNEILHTVQIDQDLIRKPYLRPVYDDPHFIIQNLWRRYAGWWDFDPARLRPVKTSVLAAEICNLSGGIDRVVARALAVGQSGDLNLAVQLVEYALRADETRAASHQAAVQIYTWKEKAEPSTMAKGIYSAAKAASEQALLKLKSTL